MFISSGDTFINLLKTQRWLVLRPEYGLTSPSTLTMGMQYARVYDGAAPTWLTLMSPPDRSPRGKQLGLTSGRGHQVEGGEGEQLDETRQRRGVAIVGDRAGRDRLGRGELTGQ